MRNLISISFGLALALTFVGSASAQYAYTTYNNNGTFCTQDVYVCPNGTTVGRTGSNCQFVCPSTPIPTPVNNSYTYTSGCYTYYYNGSTLSTTIVSYNCSNNYNNTYSNSNYNQGYNTYTYPTNNNTYYYKTPTSYSNSYTAYPYNYQNGSWSQPTYSNYNTGYNSNYYTYPSGYTDTGYSNYVNYYTGYGSNYNQTTSCYSLVGVQICF
jgi:hypothetical protein